MSGLTGIKQKLEARFGKADHSQWHEDVYGSNEPVTEGTHKSKWSHELIGGAAAYEAAKAYEDHVAKNGKPDSHSKAKEVIAGLAGAEVDFETKGLTWLDKEKAKRHAEKEAEKTVASDYA